MSNTKDTGPKTGQTDTSKSSDFNPKSPSQNTGEKNPATGADKSKS